MTLKINLKTFRFVKNIIFLILLMRVNMQIYTYIW